MRLVSLPINPAPSGATAGAFSGYDGAKLRFAFWPATRGPQRGTAVIFPGRSEYIEKYFEVTADLRRRGFAVAIMDWRGQGGSQRMLANPRKGHVVSFAEYDRDLEAFMTSVVLPSCPKPYVAFAHSMGANILLRNARDPESWFERMVMTAPMIEINAGQTGHDPRVVRFYAEGASLLGFSTAFVRGGSSEPPELTAGFEGNPLTSDQVRWSRNRAVIEAAPELAIGAPTIGWLRSAYRSCGWLAEPGFSKTVKVPVLMFAAGADIIVDTRAIEDFGADLKVGGTILIPGSRHEILQENDAIRQKFWSATDAYLGVSVLAD